MKMRDMDTLIIQWSHARKEGSSDTPYFSTPG